MLDVPYSGVPRKLTRPKKQDASELMRTESATLSRFLKPVLKAAKIPQNLVSLHLRY